MKIIILISLMALSGCIPITKPEQVELLTKLKETCETCEREYLGKCYLDTETSCQIFKFNNKGE